MFTAVCSIKYHRLLTKLVESGAIVDNKDEWGYSLLHRATAASNNLGVQKLLGFNANPVIGDRQNRTPLHFAVDRLCLACHCEMDNGSRQVKEWKLWEDIISILLNSTSKSGLRESRDKQGRLPQAALHHECGLGDTCKYKDILGLFKNHQPKISRVLGTFEEFWKAWKPPKDEPQLLACRNLRTIVAEFYIKSTSQYDNPSVIELIYQLDKGPVTIFENLTISEEASCRWIHLPANNVRPSELLMITMLTFSQKEQWVIVSQAIQPELQLVA